MELFLPYVLGVAISLALLYAVIVAAVKNAMLQHYKIVRWYEATGEWLPRAGGTREAPRRFGNPPAKPLK